MAQYTWNPTDRWSLIRRTRSVTGTLDETRLVLKDYLDPVAIVDTDGEVVERYGYDAFGPVRVMDEDFVPLGTSSCDWTFLFHGEFLDADSGLYNYGYRYYHPQLGRWPSSDPIEEKGGINLYGFVGNSVLSRYDRYGLASSVEPIYSCSEQQLPLSSPPALTLIDAIKKKGCPLYIGCRCSRQGHSGITYFKDGKISIIMSYPYGENPRLDQLVHELVHGRDFCEGWVKNDCRSHVCTELKAYAAQLQIQEPDFYEALKQAGLLEETIAGQAAGSAQDFCSSIEEAEKLGLELFVECVGDGNIY